MLSYSLVVVVVLLFTQPRGRGGGVGQDLSPTHGRCPGSLSLSITFLPGPHRLKEEEKEVMYTI